MRHKMNEQIQQEILKYLQAFSAGIEKAGTFTAEQAPRIVVIEKISELTKGLR